MNKTQYIDEVAKEVRLRFGDAATVVVQEHLKNNDIRRIGISVLRNNDEGGNRCAPIYYADSDFDGGLSVAASVDRAVKAVKTSRMKLQVEDSGGFQRLMDYEYARQHLSVELVNFQKNKKRLENVPFQRLSDLAAVAVFRFGESDDSDCYVRCQVVKGLLDSWGVSESTLFEDALKNVQENSPAVIKSMSEVVRSVLHSEPEDSGSIEDYGLFVLTNVYNIMGATVLLYDGMLDDILTKFGDGTILIPSSVHEWLLIPAGVYGEDTEDTLNQMIVVINKTQVEPDEVLGEHIFRCVEAQDVGRCCYGNKRAVLV